MAETRTENANAQQQAELDTTTRQGGEARRPETATEQDNHTDPEAKLTTAVTRAGDTQPLQTDALPEVEFPNVTRQDNDAPRNATLATVTVTAQDTNAQQEAHLPKAARQPEEALQEGELAEARREEAGTQQEIELTNVTEQCGDTRQDFIFNPATVQEDITQKAKPTEVSSHENNSQQEAGLPEATT